MRRTKEIVLNLRNVIQTIKYSCHKPKLSRYIINLRKDRTTVQVDKFGIARNIPRSVKNGIQCRLISLGRGVCSLQRTGPLKANLV